MEQIYTIPVNEAFEASVEDSKAGVHVCPFCRLYHKLEKDETELILGASMMEPDTRIKTNESGFCPDHLEKLFTMGKRLPLALMLESHLDHIVSEMKCGVFAAKSGASAAKSLRKISDGCYICDRIEHNFGMMIEAAALLWQNDPAFREKTAAQHHFCLDHFTRFLAAAQERMSKKEFADFFKTVGAAEEEYIASLRDDVSWFCKKFDYRYADEPWNGAKDAPERSAAFLKGDTVPEK